MVYGSPFFILFLDEIFVPRPREEIRLINLDVKDRRTAKLQQNGV